MISSAIRTGAALARTSMVIQARIRPFSMTTIALRTASTPSAKLKAEKEALKKQKEKTKKLAEQIKKEKIKLKALTTKHSDTVKKQKALAKERSQKAKLQKEVFKPVRKIHGFNVFLMEASKSKEYTINKGAEAWRNLSDSEKDKYKKEAARVNEERQKLFPPKPKQPATAFASFVRDQWYDSSEPTSEVFKKLCGKWRQLTQSEKDRYQPTSEAKAKFQKDLEQWKQNRLRAYEQQNAH